MEPKETTTERARRPSLRMLAAAGTGLAAAMVLAGAVGLPRLTATSDEPLVVGATTPAPATATAIAHSGEQCDRPRRREA